MSTKHIAIELLVHNDGNKSLEQLEQGGIIDYFIYRRRQIIVHYHWRYNATHETSKR